METSPATLYDNNSKIKKEFSFDDHSSYLDNEESSIDFSVYLREDSAIQQTLPVEAEELIKNFDISSVVKSTTHRMPKSLTEEIHSDPTFGAIDIVVEEGDLNYLGDNQQLDLQQQPPVEDDGSDDDDTAHGHSVCTVSAAGNNFAPPKMANSKRKKSVTKKKSAPKNSEEYKERRARNNVAVRKSREKSKTKSMEIQRQVQDLRDENESLAKRIEILTKERDQLKGLFSGLSIPPNVQKYLSTQMGDTEH